MDRLQRGSSERSSQREREEKNPHRGGEKGGRATLRSFLVTQSSDGRWRWRAPRCSLRGTPRTRLLGFRVNFVHVIEQLLGGLGGGETAAIFFAALRTAKKVRDSGVVASLALCPGVIVSKAKSIHATQTHQNSRVRGPGLTLPHHLLGFVVLLKIEPPPAAAAVAPN